MQFEENEGWIKTNVTTYKTALSMLLLIGFAILLSGGCASTAYRFADAEPVEHYNDMRPIPLPKAVKYEKVIYMFDALVRRPAVKGFNVSKIDPAKDVNSMDDILASSWFTPRLGYRNISPDQLLKGPEEVGPPQLPIQVAKAKSGGGNPGFIIEDARGKLYLIKFDPPEFPRIETTTALIVNRLFWGFGYNVPEDYLFYFRKEDLNIDPTSQLTFEDVDEILSRVAPPENRRYRSTVSLLLDGTVLGPIPATSVREDDPNDKFPHEDRRVLRALRVFSAFTNHSDIRIDNTLDVYEGEPGKGFVRHYLLDFGEAFGGHGAEHDYLWDGFRHIFSFKETVKNLVTAGLHIHDWENLNYTSWKSVGAFESKIFKPQEWKEVYPYEPIRRSQPADDYWAAKILGSLTGEHIKKLVKAAEYHEEGASEYMIKTLLERRRKLLEFSFSRVSPVDVVGFSNGELQLKDFGITLLDKNGIDTRYEIRFYNDGGKEINEKQMIAGNTNKFTVPVFDSLIQKAGGYLRVDVRVWRNSQKAPAAAQFHFRAGNSSSPRLVGVVH